jgi:hypothetical protein
MVAGEYGGGGCLPQGSQELKQDRASQKPGKDITLQRHGKFIQILNPNSSTE